MSRVLVEDHGFERKYGWVNCAVITDMSCYFTQNEPVVDFEVKLDHPRYEKLKDQTYPRDGGQIGS